MKSVMAVLFQALQKGFFISKWVQTKEMLNQ